MPRPGLLTGGAQDRGRSPAVPISGVLVAGVVVAGVVVPSHVIGGAAHHGQHLAAAGAEEPGQQREREDDGGDVEPGVVPGDRLLTDLRSAATRHQSEGPKMTSKAYPPATIVAWKTPSRTSIILVPKYFR